MTSTRRPRPFARLARCCRLIALAALVAAAGALALPAAAQSTPPTQTPTATTDAVEFYHAALDHYFLTADPAEIGLLDEGTKIQGWKRTGNSFKVWPATPQVPGAAPVCRFYGNPAKGLDSHFYSASTIECDEVKAKFPDSWLLEANIVFQVTPVSLPDGTCPSGTKAVQRTYNKRSDVNHRYTTDPSVQAAMVQKGYVEEGYGKPPVVMCAPEPVTTTPVCSVTASSINPVAGTPVTLTASCSPEATSYVWSGCSTTGPVCTYTSDIATTLTFAVSGINANGTGTQVAIPVTWTGNGNPPPTGPVPTCTLASDKTAPLTGDIVTLTATCTNSPTSFIWSGSCTPSGNKCIATSTTAVTRSYAVQGANDTGAGNEARLSLTWTVGLPTSAPVCTTISASNLSPIINTNVTLTAICSNSPTSYAWTGCTSSSSVCTDNVAVTGNKTYTVTATNAIGTSPALPITLAWQPLPPAPVCTLTSSSGATNPPAGTNITLTANCVNGAYSFTWSSNTNCGTSTSATCTTTAPTAGLQTYTVTASNPGGAGAPASVAVTWDPPPPPSCTISANTSTPTIGTNVTLTAVCSGAPTSWSWSANTGCSSSATCQTTSATLGTVTYTVTATNVSGPGPTATKDITWSPPSSDRCEPYYADGVLSTTMPWGGNELHSRDEGNFGAGAWVVKFTVPTSRTSGNGTANGAEWDGPPTQRHLTLSKERCDFRPIDPTGANGPMAVGYGQYPSVYWNIGNMLQPGQTYYINMRNRDPNTGEVSCQNATCNALINFQWP